jgi:hypothetical protein
MRIPVLAVALMLACGTPAAAEEFHYGYPLGTAPGPGLVVRARHEPHVVLVPYTRIIRVDDRQFDALGDMFRFAGYWYACKGGYWYRATGYRGPYFALDVRQIPQEIMIVPAKFWKHQPPADPPGVTRRRGETRHAVAVAAGARRSAAVVASRDEARPVITKVPRAERKPKAVARSQHGSLAKRHQTEGKNPGGKVRKDHE